MHDLTPLCARYCTLDITLIRLAIRRWNNHAASLFIKGHADGLRLQQGRGQGSGPLIPFMKDVTVVPSVSVAVTVVRWGDKH